MTTDTRQRAIKLSRYANDLGLGDGKISGLSSSEIETVIMSNRSKGAYILNAS